jgi:hypothetical protein
VTDHWLCAHDIFSMMIEKSDPFVSVTYEPPLCKNPLPWPCSKYILPQ